MGSRQTWGRIWRGLLGHMTSVGHCSNVRVWVGTTITTNPSASTSRLFNFLSPLSRSLRGCCPCLVEAGVKCLLGIHLAYPHAGVQYWFRRRCGFESREAKREWWARRVLASSLFWGEKLPTFEGKGAMVQYSRQTHHSPPLLYEISLRLFFVWNNQV